MKTGRACVGDYTGLPLQTYHLIIGGRVRMTRRADCLAHAVMDMDPMRDRLHLHGGAVVLAKAKQGGGE